MLRDLYHAKITTNSCITLSQGFIIHINGTIYKKARGFRLEKITRQSGCLKSLWCDVDRFFKFFKMNYE